MKKNYNAPKISVIEFDKAEIMTMNLSNPDDGVYGDKDVVNGSSWALND